MQWKYHFNYCDASKIEGLFVVTDLIDSIIILECLVKSWQLQLWKTIPITNFAVSFFNVDVLRNIQKLNFWQINIRMKFRRNFRRER